MYFCPISTGGLGERSVDLHNFLSLEKWEVIGFGQAPRQKIKSYFLCLYVPLMDYHSEIHVTSVQMKVCIIVCVYAGACVFVCVDAVYIAMTSVFLHLKLKPCQKNPTSLIFMF